MILFYLYLILHFISFSFILYLWRHVFNKYCLILVLCLNVIIFLIMYFRYFFTYLKFRYLKYIWGNNYLIIYILNNILEICLTSTILFYFYLFIFKCILFDFILYIFFLDNNFTWFCLQVLSFYFIILFIYKLYFIVTCLTSSYYLMFIIFYKIKILYNIYPNIYCRSYTILDVFFHFPLFTGL